MDARYLMLVFKGSGKYAGHPPPKAHAARVQTGKTGWSGFRNRRGHAGCGKKWDACKCVIALASRESNPPPWKRSWLQSVRDWWGKARIGL